MDKRAQGLPITTVILAILGIVVLVILFAIMTGRLTIFAGAANECPGVCVVSNEGGLVGVEPRIPAACEKDIEKQLFGNFISQQRGPDNKPIPCGVCCQKLA